MKRITGIFLHSIFIGLALGALIIGVPSCSSDQPDSLGIAGPDFTKILLEMKCHPGLLMGPGSSLVQIGMGIGKYIL